MASRPTRICVLGAAVCACLAMALLFAATAGARISTSTAKHDLNAMRAQAGLPTVKKFKGKLNSGCRKHNRYMRATGQFGHYEDRSSVYYSRSGARAAAASVISQPSALPSAAWGSTIYHRLALLQPRLRSSGYAGSYGFACLQVLNGVSSAAAARSRQVALYPWPPNGATSVQPSFDGNEFPNPLADAPGVAELGSPITVSVNGPWKRWQLAHSRVTSASLVADVAGSVPLSISDMSAPNAAYLQGGFALLPRLPLAPLTWHTFSASGAVSYRGRSWPFAITSRFQTGLATDGF